MPISSSPSAVVGWLQHALPSQLQLSLRNASRVLRVSDSCLPRALFCVVYINVGLLGDDDDWVLDALHWKQVAALVRQVVQSDRFETEGNEFQSASSERNQQRGEGGEHGLHWQNTRTFDVVDDIDADSGSDSDDEVGKSGIEATSLPVLIVGVSGIPRDSLVEVEIAASTKSLEIELFEQYLVSSDDRASHPALLCEGEEKETGRIDGGGRRIGDLPSVSSWPLWRPGPHTSESKLSPGQPLAPEPTSTRAPAIGDVAPMKYQAQSTLCARCVAAGFCQVFVRCRVVDDGKGESESEGEGDDGAFAFESVDLREAARLLVEGVKEQLEKAQVHGSALRQLRLFYPVYGTYAVDLTELEKQFGYFLATCLKVSNVPLLFVPVCGLLGDTTLNSAVSDALVGWQQILAVHFFAVDFLQLKTETWIRGR